jgi:putative peptidoglycan lipid II flippase
MKLVKAMSTVAGMTFLSRILGFIRDVMTATILGAGPLADAFFVALKLPNLFRRITAEGAFSVSFVPLFSERIEKDGIDEAVQMARNIASWMFVILSLFTVIALAFMPFIIMGIAPGFEKGSDQFNQAVELSRVTFPYLLLISMSALLGGVLNSVGKFAAYAFAPALFNICLIGALLLDDTIWNTPAHALAWGVFIAGFAQFVWMWSYAKKSGITLYLPRPKLTPNVKKLGILMVPGILGAGVYHLNLFADMIIASFLPSGSISYLYYADRLQQLPLGVVGIAVGTALLPLLSRAVASSKTGEAQELFNRALEAVLLLALPAATALMIIGEPIIKTLFQHGAFSSADSSMTALVLQCYAVGLPAYIAARVFQTACFARQNTKTPVKIAVLCSLFNIMFAIILSRYIGVAGIALATGLAGWIQIVLLWVILKRDGVIEFDARLVRNFFKIIVCCMAMGMALFASFPLLSGIQDEAIGLRIMALASTIIFCGGVYLLCVFMFRIIGFNDIKSFLKGQTTKS